MRDKPPQGRSSTRSLSVRHPGGGFNLEGGRLSCGIEVQNTIRTRPGLLSAKPTHLVADMVCNSRLRSLL